MKTLLKIMLGGVGAFVLLIIGIVVLASFLPSEEEQLAADAAAAIRATESAEEKKADYMRLVGVSLDLAKGFDVTAYVSSTDQINLSIAMFGSWAETIEDASSHSLTTEQADSVQALRTAAVAAQGRAFPILRDAYGPAARSALWENDITAKTKGRDFKTIEFVGGMFAANRNIAAFQEQISPTLNRLRFEKSQYRWIPNADGSVYTMDGFPDTDLVVWVEDNRFRKVSE